MADDKEQSEVMLIRVAEQPEPAEKLNDWKRKEIALCVVGALRDEHAHYLAGRITERLRKEGLEYVLDSMGISRFLYVPTSTRERIEAGEKVAVRDGEHTIYYNTKPGEEAVAMIGVRDENLKHTGSFNKDRRAYVGVPPQTMGQAVVDYALRRDSRLENEGQTRIHECAHSFNSIIPWWDHGWGHVGPLADVLWEAHSCMVSQVGDSDEEIVAGIAPVFEEHKKMAQIWYRGKAEDYLEKFARHIDTARDPRAKDMGEYAVQLVWKLRALGLDDRRVGEQIARFLRRDGVDWDEAKKVSPKVEAWLAKALKEQVSDTQDLAGRVDQVKAKYSRDYEAGCKIIEEEAVGFCSDYDLGLDRASNGYHVYVTGRRPFEQRELSGRSGIYFEVGISRGARLQAREYDFVKGIARDVTGDFEPYYDLCWRNILRDSPMSKVEGTVREVLLYYTDQIHSPAESVGGLDRLGLTTITTILAEIRPQRDEYGQGQIDDLLGQIAELLKEKTE